jgi:hypothetical protein
VKLWPGLVRQVIGVKDLSNDPVCPIGDAGSIKAYKRWNRDSLLAGPPESIYRADPHVESLIAQAQKHIHSVHAFAVKPCGPALRNGAPRTYLRSFSQAKLAREPRVGVPWTDIDGPRATPREHSGSLGVQDRLLCTCKNTY